MSKIRDALVDMVYQFGYVVERPPRLYIGTGGLSALEYAFEALGWRDPHRIGSHNACQVKGCWRPITSGGGLENTKGWYLNHCGGHRDEQPVTPKKYVYWKERTRCKVCGWNTGTHNPDKHNE